MWRQRLVAACRDSSRAVLRSRVRMQSTATVRQLGSGPNTPAIRGSVAYARAFGSILAGHTRIAASVQPVTSVLSLLHVRHASNSGSGRGAPNEWIDPKAMPKVKLHHDEP